MWNDVPMLRYRTEVVESPKEGVEQGFPRGLMWLGEASAAVGPLMSTAETSHRSTCVDFLPVIVMDMGITNNCHHMSIKMHLAIDPSKE